MLNFAGGSYDVSESRRLFNGAMGSAVSGSTSHRSPGYLQGFTADSCYDLTTNNHACPPTAGGYGHSLTEYPVSAPAYHATSYRLPFSMSHAAAAVYDEQRKFGGDCYSKPAADLNCTASISAHGNSL